MLDERESSVTIRRSPREGEDVERLVVLHTTELANRSGNLIDHVAVVSRCHKRKGIEEMANGNAGGIGLGGILVIVGIVVAIIWSVWLGIIIALVGLIAFGGFAKGKWY